MASTSRATRDNGRSTCLGAAKPLGYVCPRAKGKGITDLAELDAAAVIKARFDQRQQALEHDAFGKLILKFDGAHGLW